MMDEPKGTEEVRKIAELISKFRREFWDKLNSDIDDEIDKMEIDGYDPARGSGRGPKWADGGA